MRGVRDALFEIDDFYARELHYDDKADLQVFCECHADYFERATGSRPGPSEAQRLLTALPKGKSFEDKLLIGIFARSGGLVGIIDVICDYPVMWEWLVTLFVIDPDYLDQGLGKRVYSALEKWAARAGSHHIQTSVFEQNEWSYRFWTHLGFEPVDRQFAEQTGIREDVRILMRRSMPAWKRAIGIDG